MIAEVIEDETNKRIMESESGLQLPIGPPMIVQFRNILLKNI
jgi:hypothetical protein